MRLPIACAALVLASLSGHAQGGPRDTRPLADRLWFGGNIGLSFGSFTAIQLDPMVGYKVDPAGKFTVGVGGSYWYFRDERYTPAYSFEGYGYRLFTRYRFIPQAFAQADFLHMNVSGARNELIGPLDQRIWVPHLLIGGGYLQPLGSNAGVFMQLMFEVIQDENSVYYGQGPIFSIGAGVGF